MGSRNAHAADPTGTPRRSGSTHSLRPPSPSLAFSRRVVAATGMSAALAAILAVAFLPRKASSPPPTATTPARALAEVPSMPAPLPADIESFIEVASELGPSLATSADRNATLESLLELARHAESEEELRQLFLEAGLRPEKFRALGEELAFIYQELANRQELEQQVARLRREQERMGFLKLDPRQPPQLQQRLAAQQEYLGKMVDRIQVSLEAHAHLFGEAIGTLEPYLSRVEQNLTLPESSPRESMASVSSLEERKPHGSSGHDH